MATPLSFLQTPAPDSCVGLEDPRVPCIDCGFRCLAAADPGGRCFDCHRAKYGVRYSFYASVSAEGEDATDIRRRADGTASFNVGLPPVETPIGKRKNGKTALHTRPITHNELPTRRAREDYAKRHGLVPIADAPKRAVGGR